MNDRQIHVAIVGVGPFGRYFAEIYAKHPNVSGISIYDNNADTLRDAATSLGVERCHARFEDVIHCPEINAVHVASPAPMHAQQTEQVLKAGKHCACAVPMATSLEGIAAVIDAQRNSGKVYMMMETVVYADIYLFVRELIRRGDFGNLQYLRGFYNQDIIGWPDWMRSLPPMLYATHAVAAPVGLAECRATKVHCLGSGKMNADMRERFGNPYPIETALVQLEKDDLVVEIHRSISDTAVTQRETFHVFGDKAGFEWSLSGEQCVLYKLEPLGTGARGRAVRTDRVDVPRRRDLCPPQLMSFLEGNIHSGESAYMVHEFIGSIIEQKHPYVDAPTAANWTATGICAHESAMKHGAEVAIPDFE